MDITTATAFMTANKTTDIEIVLIDGDSVFGTALSVNSKGANVKDDNGKTRSVSLARIADLVLIEDDTFGSDDDADDLAAADIDLDARELADIDELEIDDEDGIYGEDEDEGDDEDDHEDAAAELYRMEEIVNEISDGATTAEIAAHLTDLMGTEITPKELRVHLRALGLGVGKGRKYALSSGEFRAVVAVIRAA